ncbi:ladinin-1 [Hyla sarda]|uniref:ladinin-1 n=1 Tax=Hyla sarda TaxID=327740 RepID=UPI0024C3C870|nr:ladinin-1 [Hyla sarda]
MSVSRGNWSTLSRLAKQWIEDDEEEQKREMRRRHRDISNTTDRVIEILPENDKSSHCANVVTSQNSKEEKQENPNSKKFQRKDKRTKNECENSNDGCKEEFEHKKTNCNKTFGIASNEEESQIHRRLIADFQEQEKPNQNDCNSDIKWDNLNEKCQEPVNSEEKQTPHDINDESGQEPNRHKEKKQLMKKQDVQLEEINIQRDNNIQEHNTAKHSTSISLSLVETPSDSETKSSTLATPSTSGSNSFKSQVFVSSVKIHRHQIAITSPPPIPEETSEEVPPARAVKSKVIIPSMSNTTESYKPDTASQQTSSPFKRFTPFTSSVKIMRLPETGSENQARSGLRRSSSLRLSLRKIDDRVEKYTSAIKKSESVRIPTFHKQGVLAASDGIVSKRSVFEKEESTTRSDTSKKDLNLPGDVASRINQWSNKIQQSSSSSSGSKDFKTVDVESKRRLWQQRSQSSSDTKL